jgi:deoxyribonuclease V
MKIPRAPHAWNVSPRRAVEIQRALASRVRSARPRRPFRFVAGVDAAFLDGECIAAAVVWDAFHGELVEERIVRRSVGFPYVPGLLSFRETPAVVAALRKLRLEPDAVICDAHGLAHPRRFGLACHVGLLVDRPTLGCAKSRLCGEHRDLGPRRGARAALVHDGRIVGRVVRTKDGVRPVYVSIGHAIDLASAVRLVLACAVGHRLPEPTRRADRLVAAVKRAAGA